MTHWTEPLAALEEPRRRAMTFLQTNLPLSDLDCYPFSFFLTCADHALMLRQTAPWCGALEEELFFHYVLCPRINDEDLILWQPVFYQSLWPRVAGLDERERVLEANRWCHEYASYQCQDDRTASPLTVFRSGSGRCGEESGFLVAALRSVGIAARQVYAPRWSHCDDNHAWVEAYCDGAWHFLGACEPEPILDRGWFNTASSRAMLLHSRTFGRGASPLHGAFIGQEGAVCWYNQTGRYAETLPYTFTATLDGCPAAGATFTLEVLNESCYFPIATLTADARGAATLALGRGSLHVRATLGAFTAEGDCADGHITLALAPPTILDGDWAGFDALAPHDAAVNPAPLNGGQKAQRTRTLSAGNALREGRIARCFDPERAARLPHVADLLRDARGNFDVIYDFLSRDDDPRRPGLLRTLTAKDLRDVTAEVLEHHLAHTPPSDGGISEEIYLRYLLCPRVEWEPLTPWREALTRHFSPEQRALYAEDPHALWPALAPMALPEGAPIYQNLCWPPAQALERGHCDGRSLRILCVALLRALGVPARLRSLDGAPQFWRDGAFHCVIPEQSGLLTVTKTPEQAPLYRQNWSLSRRTDSGWQLLQLADGDWVGDHLTHTLPAGQYRLITSVRLPNGNQFAACRPIPLAAGGAVTVPLCLRGFALEDLLRCQNMPVVPARTLDGAAVPDATRQDGRPTLLFWMEEGGEPTEHVLNELSAAKGTLERLPVGITFLLRGAESLRQSTLCNLLRAWPEIRVLFDDWAFDLDACARHLACDPERPPLAVAVNGQGQAVYAVSGYHVGSVELLGRIAALLCK